MLIHKNEMKVESKQKLRGGDGVCIMTHLAPKETMFNARLIAQIEIPSGASIGDHNHEGETEFYLIISGQGEVNDDGVIKKIRKGETLITGNGSVHSIKNTGSAPLIMHAVIVKN